MANEPPRFVWIAEIPMGVHLNRVDALLGQHGIPWGGAGGRGGQTIAVPEELAEQAMSLLVADVRQHDYQTRFAWLDRGGKRYPLVGWVLHLRTVQNPEERIREFLRTRGLDAIVEGWTLYSTE